MAIDWDDVEKTCAKQYKDYAPEGVYTVKCIDVEARKTSKGSYVLDFIFEEDENYKYPNAGCFPSKDKEKWRWHYVKDLFMILGAPEDKAKEVIEKSEAKGDYEYAIKCYEAAFKRLLAKKPEVEINVYFSGIMSQKGNPINNSEFTDPRVRMKRKEEKVSEAIGGDVEVVPTDDEIPFSYEL